MNQDVVNFIIENNYDTEDLQKTKNITYETSFISDNRFGFGLIL